MKRNSTILFLNSILFLIALFLCFAIGFFIVRNIDETIAAEEEEKDTDPPKVSQIEIKDTTATSTMITWLTDENSDSLINFGLDKSYGVVRDPRFDKTKHEILLDDLKPGNTYYFRITSSDESGNQGISSDYNFATPIDPSVLDGGEAKKYTDEALEEVLEKLKELLDKGQNELKEEGTNDLLKELENIQELSEKIDEEEKEEKNKTRYINETLDDVLQKIKELMASDKDKNIADLDEGALGELLDMLKKLSDLATEETEIEKGKQTGEKEGGTEEAEYVSVEKILEMIEVISSQEELEVINEAVQNRAEDVLLPPTIILDLADVEVGTDYAIISWKTDKDSNTVVSLASEDDYNENSNTPYTWNEGYPNEMTKEHYVEIRGLNPSTVYHFQVSSKSSLDLTGKSEDKTFKTKAIAPEIYNMHVSKVQEDSATIKWSTNVPCSSVITYTNLNTNQEKLEGNSSYLTVHSIQISNLVFDTYYSVIVEVKSEDGEKTVSNPLTFITIKDEVAPIISNVNTESTLFPGADNKIQTIANWKTDELARCQLFYHQGLIVADEPKSIPLEDEYVAKHVQVITNFLPSSVYKYWIVCEDETGNQKKSDDFTMLTPSQEESIIDIIIKNFESQFSWLKKK